MGINICVVKAPSFVDEHPEWDWFRYAGDRDIPKLFSVLPTDEKFVGEDSWYYRPSDFEAWRAHIRDNPPTCNEERLPKLLDLLERDADYWIYVSW